jgi:hypothetical protein
MTDKATWSATAAEALRRLDGRLFASVPETSAIFGYDRQGRTVRKGIEAGEIPAIRVGNTWRVPVVWIREQVRLGAA